MESLFWALGGQRVIPPNNYLRAILDWNALCFLLPGIPLAFRFLVDSINIYRQSSKQMAKQHSQPFLTDLVPLSDISFPAPYGGGMSGIQVSRAQEIIVDDSSGEEKRYEKHGRFRNAPDQ